MRTTTDTREDFGQLAEPFRRELIAYGYRMLGSLDDAEEIVQDVYLEAWRAYDRFEGRSSLRTWMYRIATRAFIKGIERRKRRPLPSDLSAPAMESTAAAAARLGGADVVAARAQLGADRDHERSGRGSHRAADDAAGIRGGASESAAAATGGADSAGRVGLAGSRSRRTAGSQRRGGQQRAAAGAGSAAGRPRQRCRAAAGPAT